MGRPGSGRPTRGPPGTGAKSSPCSSAQRPTGCAHFWELQDEVVRPYGGAAARPHPCSSIIDRGVHFGGDVSEDKEFPRAILFDVKSEHNLVDLLRPTDRDATGRGLPFANDIGHGMGQRYQPIDLKSYNFFQENVQAAIESSMSSWGGAMQRFDVGGTTYRDTPNRGNESLDPKRSREPSRRVGHPKWSDRWQPRFHRKSLYEIKTYGNTPFDVWSYGYEACHRWTRLTHTWKVYGSSWNMLIEPKGFRDVWILTLASVGSPKNS